MRDGNMTFVRFIIPRLLKKKQYIRRVQFSQWRSNKRTRRSRRHRLKKHLTRRKKNNHLPVSCSEWISGWKRMTGKFFMLCFLFQPCSPFFYLIQKFPSVVMIPDIWNVPGHFCMKVFFHGTRDQDTRCSYLCL
jgi:hypothetical protein